MTYIGKRYIGTAWESEMRHHERTVGQLRIKMEKLAKELSWELQQHHTRLQELQLLETPLNRESVFNQVALKNEVDEGSTPSISKKKKSYRNAFVAPQMAEPELVS